MKITYIHHSSFSVETEKATLLFDYYAGPLPAFAKDRPLIVFASHFHADHFSPVVLSWQGMRAARGLSFPMISVPGRFRRNFLTGRVL